MLQTLSAVEQVLPRLLINEDSWQGSFIDYHPPIVERLWMQWNEFRIQLHRIHPCGPTEALFHLHPWPSAVHVLEGNYEMAVGFGPGPEPPEVAALMTIVPGVRYEMTHP